MTKRYTIEEKGEYTWSLMQNIANTDGGEYSMVHRMETRTKISKRAAMRKITQSKSETDVDFRQKLQIGCSFSIVSVSSSTELGMSQHESLMKEMEMSTEENFEKDEKEMFEEKIIVRAGEKFRLYQLQFSGPGVFAKFRTRATNPEEMPPVVIRYVVEAKEHAGPLPEGMYSIKSVHGTYIRAFPGAEAARVEMQVWRDVCERWTLVRAQEDRYAIRSVYGTHLRVHPGGEGSKVDLQFDNHNWDNMPWEQFVLMPVGNGRFGIRSVHGTYIRAKDVGRVEVDVQVDKQDWERNFYEQFEFEPL